jgi:hypothetical protein
MFPGGVDVLMMAPADECVGDIILRVCRRHWEGSDCVFQDASESQTHSFSEQWVWEVGSSRKDFFVYRDQAAAVSWGAKGAVKENANTMFHFLIGDRLPAERRLLEVAVVFDKFDPAVRRFLKELQTAFLSAIPRMAVEEAA